MSTIRHEFYDIPDRTRLDFFKNLTDHFRHVLEDHLLNADEPWRLVVEEKFLQKVRQKLTVNDVSILEEAYDQVVDVLDEGINFAADLPVYVRCRMERRPVGGAAYTTDGIYFLAAKGFQVVALGDCVRTAHFFESEQPEDSLATLFEKAWLCIKRKAESASYFDRKGQEEVRHRSVRMMSEANWADHCPNPHPKRLSDADSPLPLPEKTRQWLERGIDRLESRGEGPNDER